MDKRFQFYVAAGGVSEPVLRRIMQVILAEEQLPVCPAGLGLRWAENRDLMERTIQASDYFLLLLGAGAELSALERQTAYAVAQDLPLLCFVQNSSVYTQPQALAHELRAAPVLRSILQGEGPAYPQLWQNPEELLCQVKKAVWKQAKKNTQPGWVRGTDFDMEKYCSELMRLTNRVHVLETMNADLQQRNTRHPKLKVEPMADTPSYAGQRLNTMRLLYHKDVKIDGHTVYFTPKSVYMADVSQGISYQDEDSVERFADPDTIHQFRHVMQNGFPLKLLVRNLGTARATGVRLHCVFPKGLLVLSGPELIGRTTPKMIYYGADSFRNAQPQFFAPYWGTAETPAEQRFLPFAELYQNPVLADLFNPVDRDENSVFFQGNAYFHRDEILHKDARGIQGLYLLAEKPGKYTITCEVMCNECVDAFMDKVYVVVE
jgi:hypothetical protein